MGCEDSKRSCFEKKTVLILVPKKDFFAHISQTLHKYAIPHICPINLLTDSKEPKISGNIKYNQMD